MDKIELISRVCDTSNAYLALGNQSWRAHGATFIRNPATPRRYDSNTVGLVRAESPGEIEALFGEIERAYHSFGHRMISTDALTPRAFDTRLAMEHGYREEQFMVHVLEGELKASPRPVDIREAVAEADWSAYRDLDELWWRESGEGEALFGPYDPGLHDEMTFSKRAKNPMARSWFALVDGVPRAFFSSWPGANDVGMVEDLFVHPEDRRHGLGTALIARCVADARERGAGPVLITSNVGDTPKHMYAAMGFRPLYVLRTWTKKLGAPAHHE
jgi:GNAT superfamily N-acetyltransferase